MVHNFTQLLTECRFKGIVSRDYCRQIFHQTTSPGPIGMPSNNFVFLKKYSGVICIFNRLPGEIHLGVDENP